MRRVMEEARLHQTSHICLFVEFRKTFDSVSRIALAAVKDALYSCNTQTAVLTPDGPTQPLLAGEPFDTSVQLNKNNKCIRILSESSRKKIPSDGLSRHCQLQMSSQVCLKTVNPPPKAQKSLLSRLKMYYSVASSSLSTGAQRPSTLNFPFHNKTCLKI